MKDQNFLMVGRMFHLSSLCLLVIFFGQPILGLEGYAHISSQQELNSLVLKEFSLIVARYHEQQIRAKELLDRDDGSHVLSHGYWYKNDYFEILMLYASRGKKWAIDQLAHLHKKKAFLDSYSSSEFLRPSGPGLSYTLNEQSKPSEIIENLEQILIFIDCSIAIQIAYYRAMLKFLGAEIFDRYILQYDIKKPLFCIFGVRTKLFSLIEGVTFHAQKSQIGSYFYIRNHYFYVFKNPYGNGQGFNLLTIGQNEIGEHTYIGFGLAPEGLSEEEIKATLVEDFNRDRSHELPPQYQSRRFSRIILNYHVWKFLQKKQIESVDDDRLYAELEEYLLTIYKKPKKARRAFDNFMAFASGRNNFTMEQQLSLNILRQLVSRSADSHSLRPPLPN